MERGGRWRAASGDELWSATRAEVLSQATSLSVLLVLVLVSTLKPWGCTLWDKRRTHGQRSRRRGTSAA